MQKKRLYLILFSFGLLLSCLPARANHRPLADAGLTAPPPCNLPAPTNLQMNQPNPFQAIYTWTPVAGAAGYLATLTDLSNGGIIFDIVTNPTVPFPVQPGSVYHMTVAALCSLGPPIDPSRNYAERTDRMESIVIDLVVHRGACTSPDDPIVTLAPDDTYEDASLSNGSPYFIEMVTEPNTPSAWLQFQYLPTGGQGGNGVFQLQGMESDPKPTVEVFTQNLTGFQYQGPPPAQGPPVYGYHARVGIEIVDDNNNINTYVGRFSFPTANSITHFTGSSFSSLKIYTTCGNGGSGFNGGGETHNRSGANTQTPTASTAQAALDNILPVNPFTSDLPLRCVEHPVQAVTARLFDVNGRVQLQREIQPDEFAANTCSLATADLPPGMYFLRLESAPGVFATHKVVKL